MTNIETTIEFDIDEDDLVRDAESTVRSIAEEAIDEYDFSEKIDPSVEAAVEAAMEDQNINETHICDALQENPAALLKAILNSLEWAQSRQQLVRDQSRQMEKLALEKVGLINQVEKLSRAEEPSNT